MKKWMKEGKPIVSDDIFCQRVERGLTGRERRMSAMKNVIRVFI